ncbi:rho GTPase-activating protein 39-like isoform X2 [Macrosteles quadrilineatus]|uniref:rho GTPase-activating protein 39-like isoform X2 n=1 Tax=Macrosteles quadrilineatus TaxID=74068 RepID=UPI0023E3261A|nr:rho GTPase-activating protein 39-like isoform X2 [Macrosteles quadrilineatus]
MASERMEWVEIIEPRTKEHMYANLTTGECVWDPPKGVPVKKTDNNQWWELFDQNTSRFYYYNATSQKTVWHRPQNCDIIPLAKLQTLKQNTEPVVQDEANESNSHKPKESVATQTPGRSRTHHAHSTKSQDTVESGRQSSGSGRVATETQTQTSPPASPRTSRRSHHHHHHHRHQHTSQQAAQTHTPSRMPSTGAADRDGRPRRGSHGSWYHRTTQTQTGPVQESGRSSDSSCVSLSRNSLESSVKPLESPNHGLKHSPSSGLTLSTSTPVLKKKPLSDANAQPERQTQERRPGVSVQRSASNAAHLPAKQKSFDIDISVGGGYSLGHENRNTGSVSRTRPALSNSQSNQHLSRSRSQTTPQPVTAPLSVSSTLSLDQEEEDSMHEKYFLSGNTQLSSGRRSVESTPQARRKHQHRCPKLSPDYANLASSVPPPPPQSRHSHSSSSNSSTLANAHRLQPAHIVTRDREAGLSSSDNENDSSTSVSSSPRTQPLLHPDTATNEHNDKVLKRPTFNNVEERHNNSLHNRRAVLKNNGNHSLTLCPRVDNKTDSSPVYSNQPVGVGGFILEPEMQEHLLPLQQYILEQAKLSGCYRFGDSLVEEADSLHSDEEDAGQLLQGGVEYDSDEFADDEGMSNQDDSSSQEYLHDEPSYLDTVEQYRYANWERSYPTDGRVSDYVVDSLESRMAASSGYNTNVTSLSQQQTSRSNSLATTLSGALGINTTLPLETQHASLKRKKDPPAPAPVLYSPIMERAERVDYRRQISSSPPCGSGPPPSPLPLITHSLPCSPSPLSASLQYEQLSRVVLNKKLPSESDIEKYAQDNLNIHKKGIFRKKFSIRDMLSWSKDPIRKPMLVLSDKSLKKDAVEMFKLVQIYMSDRKAKLGMSLNSVALEICNLGYNKPALRDELYIQICRQTTENPRRESLRRGWELLAICLSFFPPSPKFQTYLDSYMNRHRDPSFDFPEVGKWPIHVQVSHYASVACKRLERGGEGGKRPPRKPTLEEIDQARLQIFRPSMFGSTLQEVMALQKERFPHYKLPWIQTTLSEEVLRLQGAQTEGIFRVSADVDEVTSLKMQLDRWDRPTDWTDAHTPASLLKLWYRELYEPLIPDTMYNECIQHHDNPIRAIQIVDSLPEINRLVLSYLVRFLQIFARSEVVQQTKMDASNLAMVIAPNCLRCTSHDPRVIFDNARKEMAFMRTLIQYLDTNFVEGVV